MSISKLHLMALLSTPFLVCYDGDGAGEGGDGAGEGGEGGGAGSGGTGTTGSQSTFTQDDVNKFLADDRRKHAAKMKALEDKLSATLQSAQLTAEERESLQNSLSDVQKQLMTKEQVAAQEKKKLEIEYQTRIKELETRASTAESRYTDSTIARALTDAANENGAFRADQIVTLLRANTKLVDNKPVVDFADRHVETGEDIVTQLSPTDAVKRMRELPEIYGNLFKANIVSGMGAQGGQNQPGKVNLAKLTPAQYAKLRAENPSAVGL